MADVDAALGDQRHHAGVRELGVRLRGGRCASGAGEALQHGHRSREDGTRCSRARTSMPRRGRGILRRVSAVFAVGRAVQGRRGGGFIHRHQIEGRAARQIAAATSSDAFEKSLRVSGHVFHPGHEELHGDHRGGDGRRGGPTWGGGTSGHQRGSLMHDVAIHDPATDPRRRSGWPRRSSSGSRAGAMTTAESSPPDEFGASAARPKFLRLRCSLTPAPSSRSVRPLKPPRHDAVSSCGHSPRRSPP